MHITLIIKEYEKISFNDFNCRYGIGVARCDGKDYEGAKSSIPFNKLVEMIATQSHWSAQNLSKIGLAKLVYKIEQDEEIGDFYYFVYGKNARVKSSKDWSVVLASKGRHAFAIEVALTTDNGTTLYFKEKADHDAFMSKVRQSSYYKSDEHTECLGGSLIESDEYKNGWYMISFHAG